MYEVELKVRADHEDVRKRLEEAGATRVGTVEQADVYYDAPDRNFAETDEALRVRTERSDEGTETRLTYKGPLVDESSKTREEAKTPVADSEELEAILAGLGYEPAAEVHKERTRFRIREYTVTLDSVDGLGEFVEVETEVEADIDAARDGARDVMETLGLDPDEQIRTSYLGLLLEEDASE
ncbi:class IV adenylate cyclase [Salinibaculum rarum]|uniref:class IV adenylate cyclase n=1 Tax=Salinibaculum rarum TaxID=3058903 RepID=UPI00265E0CFB|nr:class IV adenylate cyclase [Salinibaculum sp. KK48]